jgi:hypothetical protein
VASADDACVMTRLLVVVQLVAAVGLLACGSDDGPAPGDGRDAGVDAADAAGATKPDVVPDRPQDVVTDTGLPSDVASDRPQDLASDTGGPTTFPPGCHYDCFGGTECSNGVVTTTIFAPVPCEYFKGSCPVLATYTCKEGCAIEPTNIRGGANPFANAPAAALAVLCKETPSKTAGAPCDPSQPSCLPNRAQERADAGADGGLHTEYLTCQSGTCQPPPDPAPTAANYYSPCTGATSGDGYITSDSCPYCLSFQDPGSACTRTGCTQLCWSDHQCPQGSFCDPAIMDLAHVVSTASLCRPGPRKGVPAGLTCMTGGRDQ